MANILNYLKNYHDQSFIDEPFNDADRLLFNELSYLPIELLKSEEEMTLGKVGEALLSKAWRIHRDNPYLVTFNRLRMLRYISESKRYQNIILHHVCAKPTSDHGFPFVCFTLSHPSFSPFIVFRGTDDSMLGWRESLALTFEEDLESYRLATHYIQSMLNKVYGEIELSGHSKGGHLAYMATYYLTAKERQRIKRLTSFDAPGVFEWVLEDRSFQRFTSRIIAYYPNHSVIGRVLWLPVKPIIVEATNASGLIQHILNQWEIHDTQLKLTDAFSLESDFSTDLLMEWYSHTPTEDKERLHRLIFTILEVAKVDSFNTLMRHFWSSSNQIWLTVNHLPLEDRQFILEQSHHFQELYTKVQKNQKYEGLLKQRYLQWLVPVLSIEKIHSFFSLFH